MNLASRALVLGTLLAGLPAQPMVGTKAPDFDFKGSINFDAAGQARLSDLRGRVVMLKFFATW